MPENPHPPKENVFESNLRELETQINRFKELPDGRALAPRELVKQSIQNISNSEPVAAKENEESILPDYAKDAPAESKKEVEALLQVALEEGIGKANQRAKRMHPFVMDAFHDALTGKLYPELQERGIID